MAAYYDNQFLTIHHCLCAWLLPETSDDTCQICKNYKRSFLHSKLRSIKSRLDTEMEAACKVDSHVNYRFLDTPQKLQRLRNMHAVIVKQKSQIKSLQEKIERQFHSNGVSVDDEMNDGLAKLLTMYEKEATKDKGNDTFQKIFWMQQLKALTLKSKSSVRWHPLIIRWALYLHHRSSGAYETLRKSGVLLLPSSRTLTDYRHLSPSSSPGFSTTADIQLLDMIKLARPKHLAKYVFILIDEIYLKEGLVYNKSTGSLIGFADLGGTV